VLSPYQMVQLGSRRLGVVVRDALLMHHPAQALN
jgi:hypothetical protein